MPDRVNSTGLIKNQGYGLGKRPFIISDIVSQTNRDYCAYHIIMISCSSIFLTWGSCYEKAGDICGERGYDILVKSGGIGANVSANRSSSYGNSDRSMIIKCKD